MRGACDKLDETFAAATLLECLQTAHSNVLSAEAAVAAGLMLLLSVFLCVGAMLAAQCWPTLLAVAAAVDVAGAAGLSSLG